VWNYCSNSTGLRSEHVYFFANLKLFNNMIEPRRQKELNQLLERLGINSSQLIDWQMLDLSLIHPSYSTTRNNDRLEFVGDSVLRMAATLWLQDNYADSKVGELAALRSHLVSDRTIAEIAATYAFC
jgi:ribonuclease III